MSHMESELVFSSVFLWEIDIAIGIEIYSSGLAPQMSSLPPGSIASSPPSFRFSRTLITVSFVINKSCEKGILHNQEITEEGSFTFFFRNLNIAYSLGSMKPYSILRVKILVKILIHVSAHLFSFLFPIMFTLVDHNHNDAHHWLLWKTRPTPWHTYLLSHKPPFSHLLWKQVSTFPV